MSPDGIAVKTVEGNTIAAFASRHSINANFTASVICFWDWTVLTSRPTLLICIVTSLCAHLLQQESASTGQVYDAQSSPKNSRILLWIQVELLISSHMPRGKMDHLSCSVICFLTDWGSKCSILSPKHHAGTNQINLPQMSLPHTAWPAHCSKAPMLGGTPNWIISQISGLLIPIPIASVAMMIWCIELSNMFSVSGLPNSMDICLLSDSASSEW